MSNLDALSQTEQEPVQGLSSREMPLGIDAIATAAYAGTAVSAMPGHDHSVHSPATSRFASSDQQFPGQAAAMHHSMSRILQRRRHRARRPRSHRPVCRKIAQEVI